MERLKNDMKVQRNARHMPGRMEIAQKEVLKIELKRKVQLGQV